MPNWGSAVPGKGGGRNTQDRTGLPTLSEHQSDIYLSTLRKILFAMGTDLKIVAHFPDGDVLINQFNDVRRDADATRKLAVS